VNQPFWIQKSLDQMSPIEWESICDGCGKCCLNKLENSETREVFNTNVACYLLDDTSCQCSDYKNRLARVSRCFKLTPQNISGQDWLPRTCAYRLLSEGKSLPSWHHLVSGSSEAIHSSGMSVRGKIISEHRVYEEDMEDFIVKWVN